MENGLLGFFSKQNKLDNKTYVDFLGYEVGSYIMSFYTQANTQNLVANRTYFAPIYIFKKQRFDRIGFRTASTFSGSGTLRLGIYNAGKNHNPTTVVADFGTINATASNTTYEVAMDTVLDKGFYYLAFNSVVNATTHAFVSSQNYMNCVNYSRFNDSVNTPVNCLVQDSVTGAFAPVTSLLSDIPSGPFVFMRVAA